MLGSLEKWATEQICDFFLTISVYIKFQHLGKVWLKRSRSEANQECSPM